MLGTEATGVLVTEEGLTVPSLGVCPEAILGLVATLGLQLVLEFISSTHYQYICNPRQCSETNISMITSEFNEVIKIWSS